MTGWPLGACQEWVLSPATQLTEDQERQRTSSSATKFSAAPKADKRAGVLPSRDGCPEVDPWRALSMQVRAESCSQDAAAFMMAAVQPSDTPALWPDALYQENYKVVHHQHRAS